MWGYQYPQPWPHPWAPVPQGYAYPTVLPPQPLPQPQMLPQGTAPPQDPWSVAGADPWAAGAAAAAVAAATSVAGTGMAPIPGPGAGPVPQPPTYPAPGMGNYGAQSWPNIGAGTAYSPDPLPSSVRPNVGAGTAPGPDPLPPSAAAAQPTFQGRGGLDASKSVTGITAEFLLTQTRKNIDMQLQQRSQANWKQIAKDLSSQNGKKECPGWDGKERGRTLRG